MHNLTTNLTIRSILSLLFVASSACLAALLASNMLTSYKTWSTSVEVDRLISVDESLFKILVAFRGERGDSSTLMLLSPDKAGSTRQMVESYRMKVNQGLSTALQQASQVSSSELKSKLKIVSAEFDNVRTVRTIIDSETRKSLPDRDQIARDQMLQVGATFLKSLEEASRYLEMEVQYADGSLSGLIQLRGQSWSARSFAGSSGLLMNPPVVGKRTFLPEEAKAIAIEDAKALLAWSIVREVAGARGMPDAVRREVEAGHAAYFNGSFQEMKSHLIERMIEKAPDVTIDQWRTALTPAVNALTSTSIAAMAALRDKAYDNARSAERTAMLYTVFLIADVILAGAGLAVILFRVVRPINELASTMQALANGHLETTIPGTHRRDEIGTMASSVVTFRDGLVRNRELEREAIFSREAAEAQRRSELGHLAGEFEQAVGEIVTGLGRTSAELQSTAEQMVGAAAVTVEQSTGTAAAAAQASGNVTAVASAAQELGSTVEEIGRQVQHSSNLANQAVSGTKRTTAVMEKLRASASDIDTIIGLISNIADQTNLLALNATIEAARAGSAGRGFAVVAAEVKALASQTAKAAQEVTQQVASIQNTTKEASIVITEVADRIKIVNEVSMAISSAVEEQAAATSEIMRNMEEAASGANFVSRSITIVATTADQTGNASKNVLVAAELLSSQSKNLRGQLDSFLANVKAG